MIPLPGQRIRRSLTTALHRLRILPVVPVVLLLTLLPGLAATAGPRLLRDPTRPLVTSPSRSMTTPITAAPAALSAPAAQPVLPRLQLVLNASDRRYAVIDDELLAEGDSIKGLRVLKISDETVVLVTPHGPRTLSLPADPE